MATERFYCVIKRILLSLAMNSKLKQILVVTASPRGEQSASLTVAFDLIDRLGSRFPDARVVHRDLSKDAPAHLDDRTLRALSTKDAAERVALKEWAETSDILIAELLASDVIVIATPTWNFSIPSHLKAWLDVVVRAGHTFRYTDRGVAGLAGGRRAILVIASGGVLSEEPWASWDFVEPYLRKILSFIGIDEVETIRVEGMNIPALAPNAVSKARQAVEALTYRYSS